MLQRATRFADDLAQLCERHVVKELSTADLLESHVAASLESHCWMLHLNCWGAAALGETHQGANLRQHLVAVLRP